MFIHSFIHSSCSFHKAGRILIILAIGISALSEMMWLLSIPFPSTFTYFIGKLLVALKRAGCARDGSENSWFSLPLTRCSKWCPIAFSHARNLFLHWSAVYRRKHVTFRV